MKRYSCNNTAEIYLLNKFCTDGSNSSHHECFKFYNPMTEVFRQMSGVWLILIGTIGIFGNLATITTIPYSAKRKRHGLDRNYNTTTIFILNFAFSDLLHCLFLTLPVGITSLFYSSPFGRYGCTIIIYGAMATFVAGMLSMALVALSRCLDMIMNQRWARFCDKKRNILLVLLLVWVPSLLTILMLLILQSHGIEPGWQCESGGCGFIRSCDLYDNTDLLIDVGDNFRKCNDGTEVWRLTYFSTICVPTFAMVIIVISYLLIWYKVHQSTKYFVDTQENAKRLNRRDMKMTRTMLILIVLNFTFWLPYGTIFVIYGDFTNKHIPRTAEEYIFFAILIDVFEVQYAINFFVYVARSKQYRDAFLDVLWISGRKYNIIDQLNMRRRDHEGLQ